MTKQRKILQFLMKLNESIVSIKFTTEENTPLHIQRGCSPSWVCEVYIPIKKVMITKYGHELYHNVFYFTWSKPFTVHVSDNGPSISVWSIIFCSICIISIKSSNSINTICNHKEALGTIQRSVTYDYVLIWTSSITALVTKKHLYKIQKFRSKRITGNKCFIFIDINFLLHIVYWTILLNINNNINIYIEIIKYIVI